MRLKYHPDIQYYNSGGPSGDPFRDAYTFIAGMGFIPEDPIEREKRMLRRQSAVLAMAMFMFLFVGWGSQMNFLYRIILHNASLSAQYIYSIIVSAMAFSAAIFFATLLTRMPRFAAFPVKKPDFGMTASACVILLAASVVGNLTYRLLAWLLSLIHISPQQTAVPLPGTAMEKVLYVLMVCLLPAIFEELFFRGIVMQSLRPYGDGFAILVSSVLFALLHGNLVQIPNALLCGLVLGYFAIRSGNVVTAMIMHFVYNFISTLPLLIPLDQYLKGLLTGAGMAVALVGALVCIFFLLRQRKNMFYIAPAQTALKERKKHSTFYSTPIMIALLVVLIIKVIMNIEVV